MKPINRNPLLAPKVRIAPGYSAPMIDMQRDPLDPLRFHEDQKLRKYSSWEIMGVKVDFDKNHNFRVKHKNSEFVYDETENY